MTETVPVRKDDLRLLMEHAAAGAEPVSAESGDMLNEVLARCWVALDAPGTAPAGAALPDGEWLEIAFVGRIEYRGAYVRQVTRNGQPAYRVELPDYVFGGDPAAVRHHAASAWFGDQPVSEQSVRKAWEAQQEAARLRRERAAEWERQQAERALPAGDEDTGAGGCTCEEGDLDLGCPEHGSPF